MDIEFRQAMHLLSVKAVLKRMEGLRMLHRRAQVGDPLSILAVEYVLEHDPNYAVKNRASLVLKRSALKPREGYWERHTAF